MLAPLDFQGGITQTKTAEISVVFDFVKQQVLCFGHGKRALPRATLDFYFSIARFAIGSYTDKDSIRNFARLSA